jgi:hypothetical protein
VTPVYYGHNPDAAQPQLRNIRGAMVGPSVHDARAPENADLVNASRLQFLQQRSPGYSSSTIASPHQ